MNRTTGKRTTGVRAMGSLLATAFALALATQAGAECQGSENSAVPEATPTAEFFDFGNGTVLHRPTQLVWMRCARGQAWNGSGCTGDADLLDWAGALSAADGADDLGQTDWRVPNRNELASIVETRCHGPAIHATIFPDSPAAGFWTASPVSGHPGEAWIVDFDDGALEARPTNQTSALRMVRGGRM